MQSKSLSWHRRNIFEWSATPKCSPSRVISRIIEAIPDSEVKSRADATFGDPFGEGPLVGGNLSSPFHTQPKKGQCQRWRRLLENLFRSWHRRQYRHRLGLTCPLFDPPRSRSSKGRWASRWTRSSKREEPFFSLVSITSSTSYSSFSSPSSWSLDLGLKISASLCHRHPLALASSWLSASSPSFCATASSHFLAVILRSDVARPSACQSKTPAVSSFYLFTCTGRFYTFPRWPRYGRSRLAARDRIAIRVNSGGGVLIWVSYSVSGMPKVSESMLSEFKREKAIFLCRKVTRDERWIQRGWTLKVLTFSCVNICSFELKPCETGKIHASFWTLWQAQFEVGSKAWANSRIIHGWNHEENKATP